MHAHVHAGSVLCLCRRRVYRYLLSPISVVVKCCCCDTRTPEHTPRAPPGEECACGRNCWVTLHTLFKLKRKCQTVFPSGCTPSTSSLKPVLSVTCVYVFSVLRSNHLVPSTKMNRRRNKHINEQEVSLTLIWVLTSLS